MVEASLIANQGQGCVLAAGWQHVATHDLAESCSVFLLLKPLQRGPGTFRSSKRPFPQCPTPLLHLRIEELKLLQDPTRSITTR